MNIPSKTNGKYYAVKEGEKMNVGDIVVVVGFESIPTSFLGKYGKITYVSDYKVTVEFEITFNGRGSFSHTAIPKDLKKIGVSWG